MLKKEGKIQSGSKDTSEFDVLFKEAIAKKNNVVHRFSSSQLEELLKTSTKNVAQEVVSCMIPVSEKNELSKGLLLELEKIYPEEAKLRKKQYKEQAL